jgi:hypothetical protein
MPNDYADLGEYAKTRAPAYGGTTFEGICETLMTARQTEKLRKMLDFSFARHPNPKLNLPEEHLAAIEKHLRERASQLLGLSKQQNRTMASNRKNESDRIEVNKQRVL